jgi:hypothetical protein
MCMFMRLLSLPVIILVSALICKLKLDLVKIPHHFGPSFVLRKVYQKVHIDCQSLVFFFLFITSFFVGSNILLGICKSVTSITGYLGQPSCYGASP